MAICTLYAVQFFFLYLKFLGCVLDRKFFYIALNKKKHQSFHSEFFYEKPSESSEPCQTSKMEVFGENI